MGKPISTSPLALLIWDFVLEDGSVLQIQLRTPTDLSTLRIQAAQIIRKFQPVAWAECDPKNYPADVTEAQLDAKIKALPAFPPIWCQGSTTEKT